jgi:hypothetical protein
MARTRAVPAHAAPDMDAVGPPGGGNNNEPRDDAARPPTPPPADPPSDDDSNSSYAAPRTYTPDEEDMMKVMGWLKFSKREQRLLLSEFGVIKRFKEYTSANVVSRRSREKDPKQRIAFTATYELYLNQIIEWVKDEAKLGKRINIRDDPAFRWNTIPFFQFIEESHRRAVNREKEKQGLAARIAAASPGMLKNGERDWDKWVTGLKTVLTLTRGVTDVSLIYVIRDDGQNILNQLPADYPFAICSICVYTRIVCIMVPVIG